MQANKISIQDILAHDRQYIIPLFQRSYSWKKSEWDALWNDLVDLLDIENTNLKTHFLGAVMTMDLEVAIGQVPKSLVIDGQQRLTTLLIILVIMRNRADEIQCTDLGAEIQQKFLTNQFKQGEEKYKLIPTQVDRLYFKQLVDQKTCDVNSSIGKCHEFFLRKIKADKAFLENLKLVIFARLSLIAVTLDKDDDPYLIFESLNAKGRELTQADLIRNYIFMKIREELQEEKYTEHWKPMEEALGTELTEFVRYYLSKNGAQVRRSDIYSSFKALVDETNAVEYLDDLSQFSQYYSLFLNPEKEQDSSIKKHLTRIKNLEVSVMYPFILGCYNDYANKRIEVGEFIEVLTVLENFVIRRFVCNIPTQGLNRIFISLYSQASKGTTLRGSNFVDNVKKVLQIQKYPSDTEFYNQLLVAPLYSKNSSKRSKTKVILEVLEESFMHKELVDLDQLTIEHVMPQSLNKEWKQDLGQDWSETHSLLVHSLGNLTLTAYNSELSNASFGIKKPEFENSNLELNKYFKHINTWRNADIETRAQLLAARLLSVYPFFGSILSHDELQSSSNGITGRKPKSITFFGEEYSVKTWRDVLEVTLNEIATQDPDKFIEIQNNLSRFIGTEHTMFRSSRKLKNDVYVEVNLSAKDIYTVCLRAIEIAECQEEWDLQFTE